MTYFRSSREDTFVPETIHCDTHGEAAQAFVCSHLVGETTGLGFNRDDPSEEEPFPDAWCDDCEIIRSAHNGWDDVPDELCKVVLLCSACYERARIRNTRPSTTLRDLADLQWKCGSCEEWHSGPLLDLSFNHPHYWSDRYVSGCRWSILPSGKFDISSKTFLDEDYCVINDEDFFVRGIIQLPILGTAETFCWGVWGSLSRANFEILLKVEDDPKRAEVPLMFSWLSSQISDYPETLSLKMYVDVQEPGNRPLFRLEESDHPLSQEYHHGITPERVKEITFRSIPAQEQ